MKKDIYPPLSTPVFLYFSEWCKNCNSKNTDRNKLTELYLNTIRDNILPELQKTYNRYAFWCTLKESSPICKILKAYNTVLPVPMTMENLTRVLTDIFHDQDMLSKNNPQIVILNKQFQDIFPDHLVFLPDLEKLLIPHIHICPQYLCRNVQSDMITEDLYITSPSDILYEDPTSLFWLQDDLNMLLNKKQKITYTWAEILTIFKNYIVTNKQTYLKGQDDNIIWLTSTPLYNFFPCTHLDLSQIETLLKEHTIFLGRETRLPQFCDHIKFRPLTIHVWSWLDAMINKQFLPRTYPSSPAVLFSEFQSTAQMSRVSAINRHVNWRLGDL